MRNIDDIVIHCSDSQNGARHSERDINDWHKLRWKASPSGKYTGYHYVIRCDGVVEPGRPVSEVGCHCPPNSHNLGICLIGRDKFTPNQWSSLKLLVIELRERFVGATISGHKDHESARKQGKTCPNFDVKVWVENDYTPKPENILR